MTTNTQLDDQGQGRIGPLGLNASESKVLHAGKSKGLHAGKLMLGSVNIPFQIN